MVIPVCWCWHWHGNAEVVMPTWGCWVQVLGIKFSYQICSCICFLCPSSSLAGNHGCLCLQSILDCVTGCLLSVLKVLTFGYHFYDAPSGLTQIWSQHGCCVDIPIEPNLVLPSCLPTQVDLLQMWGASSRTPLADSDPVDILCCLKGDNVKG